MRHPSWWSWRNTGFPEGGRPCVRGGRLGTRKALTQRSPSWHSEATLPSSPAPPPAPASRASCPLLFCTFAHSPLGQECPFSALFQQENCLWIQDVPPTLQSTLWNPDWSFPCVGHSLALAGNIPSCHCVLLCLSRQTGTQWQSPGLTSWLHPEGLWHKQVCPGSSMIDGQ